MQGLSFGNGDKPQPTKVPNNTDNISLEDLFKPNAPRCQSTTEEQSTNDNQTQSTSEKSGIEKGKEEEKEYISEDFVISRIDSSGNMRRGKK